MIRQIGFELFKMSRRPRSYVGFGAFLVIVILMLIGANTAGTGDGHGAARLPRHAPDVRLSRER